MTTIAQPDAATPTTGRPRSARLKITFVTLLVLVALTVVLTPLIGSTGEPLSDVVFWKLRVPRLALALLAGFALSIAGVTFQSTFRNPLATPFTLGVASGANLFVAIGVNLAGRAAWWSAWIEMLLATAGAVTTMLVVYGIARLRRGTGSATLLLAGISIAFFCAAGIVLMQALANEQEAVKMIRWTMGTVEIVGDGWAWSMLPSVIVALLMAGVVFRLHRELDLLMIGEQLAAGRGVNVGRARAAGYFAASALTAATVALCGPIAFVGLVVPHTMRAIVGPRHALLIPAAALGGMVFLPVCDTVARNLLPWLSKAGVLEAAGLGQNLSPLPVGVLTNLLGAAFFLYILLTRRSDQPIV